MRQIRIGKILLTDGGEWNASTGYSVLTYVRHNGDGWWSAKANVNSQPSSGNTNWVQATNVQSFIAALKEATDDAQEINEAIAAAETLRVSAETARANAELARSNAELSRQSAETARVTAENARVSAESTRVSQENARKSAESSRQSQFEVAMTNVSTATNLATQKASAAQTAASNANTKAALADAAATRANTAAASAEAIADSKVDKVAGKSLIDANVASKVSFDSGTQEVTFHDEVRFEDDTYFDGNVSFANGMYCDEKATFEGVVSIGNIDDVESDINSKVEKEEGKVLIDETIADILEMTGDGLNVDANFSAKDIHSGGNLKVDGSVKFGSISDVEAKINSKADSITIGDLRDLDTEAHGSLVEAINEVYGYAYEEDGHVYGVRHYYNQSSPILTRFQTSQLHDLHQLLPVQSLMRRCILKNDGEVAYYLDHSDSTKKENGDDAVLDGTDGMVMVEIPTHYRKHTLVENADDPSLSYYETAISLLPFSGAFKVNKCYISAYEATIDNTTNRLASVVNTTARYRGGNNNADWDGTNKSLLGLPATVMSLTSFRSLARARGSEWNCQEYDIYTALYWLYTIEYANLNCQAAFDATRDGSGRHQGGLGDGVTNMPDWGGHNSYYPIIPCGVTNELGNATGVVTYNVKKADGETIHYAAKVPSYRGVENPFGHIWKWTDGFLAIGNGTTQEYYICHDRSKYASTKNANYVSKGQSAGANGYVKEFLRNAEGDILTKSVGGGSTTYGCDYHYEAWSNGTTYGLHVGGYAANGAAAGLACTRSYNAPSNAYAHVGSRLCWSLHSKIVE